MGEVQVIEAQPKRSVVERGAPMAANSMQLVAMAVQQGADIDKLERLLALHRDYEANEARKAYTDAMARFKSNPPEILKSKHVSFTNRAGTITDYHHATIGDVCGAITKALAEVEISHRWQTDQSSGRIKVTCVLTHKLGHSESATLEAAPDESGGKNSIQAIGSAVTYLQRYTLIAVTGVATNDVPDPDGRGRDDKQREANKPKGYDSWAADMRAKAGEGTAALQQTWKKSPATFRVYATADGDWWPSIKALAKAADNKSVSA